MNLWMNRLINKATVIYTSFAFRESINTGKLMVNVSVCSTISVVASASTECGGACTHHLQTARIDINRTQKAPVCVPGFAVNSHCTENEAMYCRCARVVW